MAGLPAGIGAGKLTAEVDELDFADRGSEETGSEALEFFNGVGGETAQLRIW